MLELQSAATGIPSATSFGTRFTKAPRTAHSTSGRERERWFRLHLSALRWWLSRRSSDSAAPEVCKGTGGHIGTFGTTMDDGAIALGAVELTANAVTLSVNSEARAARGRALLEPVLTGSCALPLSSGRPSNR
jgi:hypothetical protein